MSMLAAIRLRPVDFTAPIAFALTFLLAVPLETTLVQQHRLPQQTSSSDPPPSRSEIDAVVATLASSHRGDAFVIGANRTTSLGAVRGRPVSSERGVPLQAFGTYQRSGPLVVDTGVALREVRQPGFAATTTSFVVPCHSTSLAVGQFGFVYLGVFIPAHDGRSRLTELGLQINPPPHGGTPVSVQPYLRMELPGGVRAVGTPVHIRCDRGLRISIARIGTSSLVATFAGPAVPLRSRSVSLVALGVDRDRALLRRCTKCTVERITALAVRVGTQSLRRGTRLGVEVGDARPRLAYAGDDFVHDRSVVIPQVVVRDGDGGRVAVGIDERGTRATR